MERLLFLSFLLCYSNAITAGPMIRFANYYQDHMVLQQAPKSAIVWGYTQSSCKEVNVMLDKNMKIQAKLIPMEGQCKWVAVLPATKAGGPHTITASSAAYGSVSITDVLFGDVWVCGGQSNMAFTLSGAFNATEEIAKAADYPNLRIITVGRELTDKRVDEPTSLSLNWSIASPKSVPGFSAVCWLYGQNIYNQYKVPLGLISNNWGGTPDEAWSSPEALSNCPSDNKEIKRRPNNFGDQKSPSALWNAMMYPFTQMTIYGAIWYQGEANSGNPSKYNCTFPAMIADWRKTWHERTQQTDPMFPFGFVQLAANGVANNTNNGFPGVRWSQTASYGYVPNPAMKNVFMAVAMDLGDPKSPHGSIHPRDKQDVGMRLALAGRVIAYGESATSVYWTGPLVDKATVVKSAADVMSVTMSFRDLAMSTKTLEKLRSPYGFEVGCTTSGKTTFVEGTAKGVEGNSNVMVEFPMCPSGSTATAIRYAWRDDPCVFKTCAVYSGGLPSPPFMMSLAAA